MLGWVCGDGQLHVVECLVRHGRLIRITNNNSSKEMIWTSKNFVFAAVLKTLKIAV